jgi:tetratricopeptide (TPR) repeat protein
MGKYNQALVHMERALEDEQDAYSYQWCGAVYHQLRDLEAALQKLNRAVDQDSRTSDHYYWRAQVLLELKRYDEALEDLQRITEMDREDPVRLGYDLLWRSVVYTLKQGQRAAEADLDRVAEVIPHESGVILHRLCLALRRVLTHQCNEARAIYQTVLAHGIYTRHVLETQVRHLRLLARLFPARDDIGELEYWLDQAISGHLRPQGESL